MKKLISAIVLFAVILSGTTLAATSSKQINVEYGISVKVNGNILVPKDVNGKTVDPFVYDGTTYVPVRAISEALGASVGYDAATNSAAITGKNEKINRAGEVKDCVEKIKIVNGYENLAYEFSASFENLLIIIAYYKNIPVNDLKLIKAEARKDFNAVRGKAVNLISSDSEVSFIDANTEKILNISDQAIEACITYSSLQNQENFNIIANYVSSGIQASLDLLALTQEELADIYTEIDAISTDGAAPTPETTKDATT